MEEIPTATLEALVRRHRPKEDGRVSLVRIPTGKFNTSFFVRAGGEELVLRIAPADDEVFVFYERDMMRQEPEVHALVRERTGVPVARVIAFDDSRELIDRNFLLMERLPGAALSQAHSADADAVLRTVGRWLAEVHAITADRYGYLGAHAPMEPQDAWAAAFEVMWNKLVDDVVSVGHYDAEESRFLRRLLGERLHLFDRPVAASLLHMDVWGQNILVNADGEATGLVDWDRALWGDPEIEFAVLDYCGVSGPAFWEGYGRPRDASPEACTRQVFYLLYELQKYIVIRQGRGGDARSARAYKRQVMDVVHRHILGEQ